MLHCNPHPQNLYRKLSLLAQEPCNFSSSIEYHLSPCPPFKCIQSGDVSVDVVALLNDTTGTQLAVGFEDPNCHVDKAVEEKVINRGQQM